MNLIRIWISEINNDAKWFQKNIARSYIAGLIVALIIHFILFALERKHFIAELRETYKVRFQHEIHE